MPHLLRIFFTSSLFLTIHFFGFSENSLNGTKNLIKEWVDTEKVKSKEKEEADLKIHLLKNSNSVLSKELELLKTSLEAQKSQLSKSDKEREIWIKKNKTLTQRRDALEKSLTQLKPKLLGLKKRLPPKLTTSLKNNFQKLESSNQEQTLGEQMQILISLLIAIQDFDKRIHTGYEVLKDDTGEEIEVKVLYIGLSTAYYSSNDGKLAGYGSSKKEWTWTSAPSLAETIKNAFKIYESEIEEARFLPLPVGGAS